MLEQLTKDPAAAADPDRLMELKLLMSRKSPESLDKAAVICKELLDENKKELLDEKKVPHDVSLMLAQVYDLQGKADDARKLYFALASREHPSPDYLAAYIDFLLRRGPEAKTDEAKADQSLKQLEKLVPNDLTTLQLRGRWLRDQNRPAEIEPMVEGRMKKVLAALDKRSTAQEARLDEGVGKLYLKLELYSAAERWYRRLQKLLRPLALSLAKQGRIQEALALCLKAAESNRSPEPALTMVAVLSSSAATPQDFELAERFLKNALNAHKDQPDLLYCLAGIRVLQDRPAEAIDFYRQVRKLRPNSIGVLNNLATLLAERPDPQNRSEALDCIDQAIDLAGPQPGLLDTKGMALYYDGKAEQAVKLLQTACDDPNPDPRYLFHLAVVRARLNQLDKARAALRKARDADLEHQVLTKKDLQLLADLERQLGQSTKN